MRICLTSHTNHLLKNCGKVVDIPNCESVNYNGIILINLLVYLWRTSWVTHLFCAPPTPVTPLSHPFQPFSITPLKKLENVTKETKEGSCQVDIYDARILNWFRQTGFNPNLINLRPKKKTILYLLFYFLSSWHMLRWPAPRCNDSVFLVTLWSFYTPSFPAPPSSSYPSLTYRYQRHDH